MSQVKCTLKKIHSPGNFLLGVFNNYKNSNYKKKQKTEKESTKIRNIFCKVSSPFFSEGY